MTGIKKERTAIEKARKADLAAVRDINSLLRTGVRDFYWDSSRYAGSAIAENRCFVVRRGGAIAASIILENRNTTRQYPQKSLAIGALAVRPEHRRDGWGTALVEFAKARAFQQNKRLYAESFYEFRKLGFYRKLGFQRAAPKKYRGRPYHVLFFCPRAIPVFPKMKRIGLRDRLEVLSYLKQTPVVPSDITFENLFAFDSPSRKTYLSLLNDNVVVFVDRGDWRGFYPVVGDNRMDDTILECLTWLRERECSRTRGGRTQDRKLSSSGSTIRDMRRTRKPSPNGCFTCVPAAIADGLMPATKSRLSITGERQNFDYLYDATTLFDFHGPGLRTQRQHLARFLERSPELRIVGPSAIRDVGEFQKRWLGDFLLRTARDQSGLPDVIAREDRAIRKALAYAGSLDLHIGGLYVDDALCGFSVASVFAGTAYIHFEKASRQKGTYQALLHLFGKGALPDNVTLVNREQDLGVPGLRTSKTRYRPISLMKKCRIALR